MKKYHLYTILFLMVQIMLVLLSVFVFNIENMTVAEGTITNFNKGWMLTRPDGSHKYISSLPYSEIR